jgi:hypothetical protein
MATILEGGSPETSASQPPVSTGDARLDTIRGKQAAGETLTASERGYLAHKNAVANGRFVPGKGARKSGPSRGRVVAGPDAGNPLLAVASEAAAPVAGAGKPPPDPSLVKATVSKVLGTADSFAQRWIYSEALACKSDRQTAVEFQRSIALDPETKGIAVDTSPEALEAMGIDVTKFPLYMFLGAIGTYALGVLVGVSRVKNLAKARAAQQKAPTSNSQAPEKPQAPILKVEKPPEYDLGRAENE